jgi:hypothetical protein
VDGAVSAAQDEALEYGAGWRIKGVVDDTDTCEHCGRRGLKRVVAMVPLDADGNEDGDAAYFGTGCATGYVRRGTLRGRLTSENVWTAARAAQMLREQERELAGERLAKYEHVIGFDPIQKAAVFFAYNPHCAHRGTAWGAQEVDQMVSAANKALEGVSDDFRAAYIEKGRKTLGLPQRSPA